MGIFLPNNKNPILSLLTALPSCTGLEKSEDAV